MPQLSHIVKIRENTSIWNSVLHIQSNQEQHSEVIANQIQIILRKISDLIDSISRNDIHQEQLSNDKQELSVQTGQLASFFRKNTSDKQKVFVEMLMKQNPDLWNWWIEDGVDTRNRPITKVINTWEQFDVLPQSIPEEKYHTLIVKNAVTVREKVVLAVYWITILKLTKAFQKRI